MSVSQRRLQVGVVALAVNDFSNRVFHKLFTIQEWQYCQLCFSCAIRNELPMKYAAFHTWSSYTHWHLISHLLTSCDVDKKEIVNVWEHKIGNNANIGNFVHLWKTRIVKCWSRYRNWASMTYLDTMLVFGTRWHKSESHQCLKK